MQPRDPWRTEPRLGPCPGFGSVMVMLPVFKASGHSMDDRSVIAGKPSMVDSSLMVPLSDSTHAADICSLL